MQIQSNFRPIAAAPRFPLASFPRTRPLQSAPASRPRARGLTRAQLREIIIEQLG
jgi:hypothetical protein